MTSRSSTKNPSYGARPILRLPGHSPAGETAGPSLKAPPVQPPPADKDGASPPRDVSAGAKPAPRRPRQAVHAGPGALRGARALQDLLTAAADVLPRDERAAILPFRIGIHVEFQALLKPDAAPEELARALRYYTRSPAYLMACAADGAMRHDLEGRPLEPMSEADRENAKRTLQGFKARKAKVAAAQAADPSATAEPSRRESPEGANTSDEEKTNV